MMVAAVAYQQLTQATKNRVDALLLLNPDRDNWLDLIPPGTSAAKQKRLIFMIAATWADRIKSDPDYHTDGTYNGNRPPNDPSAGQNIGFDDLARHKYRHFVDLPVSNDNTPLPPVPTPNAETQIAKFRAVLNSPSNNNPNLEKLKSYDLSWLLHLVGDPINRYMPQRGSVRHSQKATTAAMASSLLLPPTFTLFGTVSLAAAGHRVECDCDLADRARQRRKRPRREPLDKRELRGGQADCLQAATHRRWNGTVRALTQAYKTSARSLAEKRIALAAARLAKILNEELK